MGVFDPLFWFWLRGIIGIWGLATIYRVDYNTILPELILVIGGFYLNLKNWKELVPKEEEDEKSLRTSEGLRSLFIINFILTVILALYNISTGAVGDSRLKRGSAIKKVFGLIKAVTYPFFYVYVSIKSNIKYLKKREIKEIYGSLIGRLLLGGSKAAGVDLINWCTQRWLNPSSPLKLINPRKIIHGKIKAKSYLLLILPISLILPTILIYRYSMTTMPQIIINRLIAEYDIYYYINELSINALAELSNKADWLGNFVGSIFSPSEYNFGSYAKAIALNFSATEAGPNPRLFAFLNIKLGSNLLVLNSIIAGISILGLIKARNYILKKSAWGRERKQIYFVGVTNLWVFTLSDTTAMKYGIVSLLSSVILVRIFKIK